MSDFDWKKTLATVAPGLATALGGPLSGTAVAAIVNALGIQGGSADQAKAAVKAADPADLLKLKEADEKFVADMAKLGIDILTLENSDRASARNREVSIKDNTTKVLAYLIVGTFLGVACSLVLGGTKVDTVMGGTVLGYLSAKAEQVASYYFGSSSGSELKTRLMGLMDRKGA
ncbi:hypothetical protein [Aquabacterium sp.]|uniref:hypothetical protein n=1 Tax=Aquabacterium sp. TaxID=1872578 RepID=UPI0040377FA8